jgi:hypothetical protein
MTSRIALKITPIVAGALLAMGMASAARAQSAAPAQALIEDKFVFNLGAYFFSTDVNARLNGSTVQNPDIDFDQAFGKANDSTRIRGDALWRITPRQHLRFMAFDNTVDRTHVIDQPINWGDYTFNVGANVESKLKYRVYELAYEYAFLHEPSYEVAASLGVHYTDVSMQLSGVASFTDSNGTTTTSFSTKQSSVPVPLPVIGMRGLWAVSPTVALGASAQFFKAKVGDYDGYLSEFDLSATWMFSQNWGVGLGYNAFRTTVDVNKNDFDGRLRFGYSGARLFLTGAF